MSAEGSVRSSTSTSRKHFAHEVIQHREMHLLIKADASKEIADMFTKPLPHPRYKACILAMLDALT